MKDRPPKHRKPISQCPYSASCFACPMKDCVIEGARAYRINRLPTDDKRRRGKP